MKSSLSTKSPLEPDGVNLSVEIDRKFSFLIGR